MATLTSSKHLSLLVGKFNRLYKQYNDQQDEDTFEELVFTFRSVYFKVMRKILQIVLKKNAKDNLEAFGAVRECYHDVISHKYETGEEAEINEVLEPHQESLNHHFSREQSEYILNAIKSDIGMLVEDGSLDVRSDAFEPDSSNTILVNGNWTDRTKQDFIVVIITFAIYTKYPHEDVVPALAYIKTRTERETQAPTAQRTNLLRQLQRGVQLQRHDEDGDPRNATLSRSKPAFLNQVRTQIAQLRPATEVDQRIEAIRNIPPPPPRRRDQFLGQVHQGIKLRTTETREATVVERAQKFELPDPNQTQYVNPVIDRMLERSRRNPPPSADSAEWK